MKRIVKIIGVVGILLALLISTVHATVLNVDVNEEAFDVLTSSLATPLEVETIDTDVFLLEDNVSIKNNVNGNIYAVGEKIDISSENIDGDIFVIGENVTITSNVTGNVYGFANNLNISGNIKDAFVLGENINLNENTTCRDFKVIGSIINVDGTVNRDLYAAVGDVYVSDTGKVGGLLSTVTDISVNKENVNEIQIIEDAFANLEKTDEQMEEFWEKVAQSIIILFFISAEMTGLLIIAIIILLTSKKQINTSDLKEHGIIDALYGLLYYVIAIFIIIALMFTIIGIPVSLVMCLILWFIFWKITVPVASIQFTKAILKQENKSKVLVWFVSFIIFTLVQVAAFIPTVGGLIKSIVSLYGFGYMIRSIIRKNKAEENKTQVEVV